jgi:hypothetical protein
VRIDPCSQLAEDGAGLVATAVGLQLVCCQPAHAEAIPFTQRQFVLQDADVATLTGIVETVHGSEIDIAILTCELLEGRDGIGAGPIGKYAIGLAIVQGQLGQMRIDFLLQQRRAGQGAAPAEIALLHHHDLTAMGARSFAISAPLMPPPLTATSQRTSEVSLGDTCIRPFLITQ